MAVKVSVNGSSFSPFVQKVVQFSALILFGTYRVFGDFKELYIELYQIKSLLTIQYHFEDFHFYDFFNVLPTYSQFLLEKKINENFQNLTKMKCNCQTQI